MPRNNKNKNLEDKLVKEEAKQSSSNRDTPDISDKLEDSKVYENYIKGEIVGEMGAAAGSYIGAKLGETYLKSSSRLLNILSGSIPGDYLMSSIFSGAYWARKNKDKYRGWKGKKDFIKDQIGFHVREAPATVTSYLAYAPITAIGLALGAPAGIAAVIASVLSSALYISGSYLLNKGYLKKLGRKQKEGHLSQASSQVPQSYLPPQPAYRPA